MGPDEITIEQILAAAPLIAPEIAPERVAEIAPRIRAILSAMQRLDELDLSPYEPTLTLSLRPED